MRLLFRKTYNIYYSTLLAALLLLAIVFAPHIKRLTGDGIEYLLYAHAIKTNLAINIQRENIDYVIRDKTNNKLLKNQLYSTYPKPEAIWTKSIGKKSFYVETGFVISNSGKVYTWHFWTYSLIVAPFLFITDFFKLEPPSAFWLCNWFLILSTISYCCFHWKADIWQKVTLTAGLLLSGTTYYSLWTHPEIFTASFMLLGLMAFTDKRYKLSLLAVALSSTQNPPIIFLLLIIVSYIFIKIFSNFKTYGTSMVLKSERVNIVTILLSILISISPMIFYYTTLGVLNPIASLGYADASLISIDRLISLYFDLNMGMLIAMPAIFVSSMYMFFCYKKRNIAAKTLNYFEFIVPISLGIAISIIMALPSLASINWNHGCNIFNRYAYWLGIPILFGLTVNMGYLRNKIQRNIAICLMVIQSMVVLSNGVFGNSIYLEFKPLAKLAMLHFPSIYNPIPEVFAERLNNKEGMPRLDGNDSLIMIFPNDIKPTKILVYPTKLKTLTSRLPSECVYKQSDRLENGWVYLNLDRCKE